MSDDTVSVSKRFDAYSQSISAQIAARRKLHGAFFSALSDRLSPVFEAQRSVVDNSTQHDFWVGHHEGYDFVTIEQIRYGAPGGKKDDTKGWSIVLEDKGSSFEVFAIPAVLEKEQFRGGYDAGSNGVSLGLARNEASFNAIIDQIVKAVLTPLFVQGDITIDLTPKTDAAAPGTPRP